MVQSCAIASNEDMPHTKPSDKTLPFWNEIAEPYKKKSLFWHWIWVDCGKPRDGNVARIMRSARSKYHVVVKELKKNENNLRKERMGEAISSYNQRNLWDEVQRVLPSGKLSATEIDRASEPLGIAEVFAEELVGIRKQLSENIIHKESLNECNISVNDIEFAIKKTSSKRKGNGDKGFYSDHIIMSTHRFKVLLSLLINTMLTHGYNANLLVSIISSIPKDLR